MPLNRTGPTEAPDSFASRPLWRTFLAFLGPMILANILQGLSGTLNNVFVGQMLGTRALAAVAGMFPILFFFISLVIGVGAGASVLIGQAWGARERHKVKAIAGTALALGLLIGLVVSVVVIVRQAGAMAAKASKEQGPPKSVGFDDDDED